MANSTYIGKLLGPALICITGTEWINLDVLSAATGPSFAPYIYLNGTLIFIAGLAIVRAHNVWVRRWPVLITVVGWLAIAAGLGRMAAPLAAQHAGESSVVIHGSLVALFAIGLVVTYKSYVGAGI